MFKIKKLGESNILHVTFENQHLCNSSFMRLQEFYESPEFKGNYFTREEYEDWYAAKYGDFTYYKDWAGFNVPLSVFREFLDMFPLDDMTQKERNLILYIQYMSRDFDTGYIIGSVEGAAGTMRHEVAHGLYETEPTYRERVNTELEKVKPKVVKKFNTKVLEEGYCEDVLTDELHAYIVDGIFNTYDFNFSDKQIIHLGYFEDKLNDIVDEYMEKLKIV